MILMMDKLEISSSVRIITQHYGIGIKRRILVGYKTLPFLFVACGPDVSVQPISSCKTMSRLSKYSNVDIGIAAAPATVDPS